MKMPSPTTRRYMYRVANAGLAVAVGYGAITGNESMLWLLLVNALLGLADANVHQNATVEPYEPPVA
jgi:hypothetical protein